MYLVNTNQKAVEVVVYKQERSVRNEFRIAKSLSKKKLDDEILEFHTMRIMAR